jgi:glycerophosphoryl diester phosphodiesterase
MLRDLRDVVVGSGRDFLLAWRSLVLTDLVYKLVAFAILSPATALFVRWLMMRTHSAALTDADILLFFVNTPRGLVALFIGGALLITISILEVACLMGIGFAGKEGARLGMARALTFGAVKAQAVLRLAFHIVWRVLLFAAPFVLAIGAIYWFLLHDHDINFYLARKPPVFWGAVSLAGLVLAGLAALMLWMVCRWVLSLPLVLFEGVSPRSALWESAKRSVGHRRAIALAFAAWAVAAAVLSYVPTGLVKLLGREVAPFFAGSVGLLLLFMVGLAFLWGLLWLAAGIVSTSAVALLLNRIYHHLGDPRSPVPPAGMTEGRDVRLSRRAATWIVAAAVIAAVGVGLLVFIATHNGQPVLVIAHRGASLDAPENTLSAFRKAIEQKADYVEMDVQESKDGVVVVVHDSDLMKVGGSPLKIWEATAEELRAVDLGSRVGPQFAGEKVPTLEETLQTCKGKAKMVIELKSYGHDEHLEEKVVALVEAAGMQDDCIIMSLDHHQVQEMKGLRPNWRCGLLAAKAVGDPTALKADFLAVENKVATARFIRRAHRAGMPVFVWTLDDPAKMFQAISFGADGLITNKPALARQVIERRNQMSDAQRLLGALLVRLGASTNELASEDALRP